MPDSTLVKMVFVYLIILQVCVVVAIAAGEEIPVMYERLQILALAISAKMEIARDLLIQPIDATAEVAGQVDFVKIKYKGHAATTNVKITVSAFLNKIHIVASA